MKKKFVFPCSISRIVPFIIMKYSLIITFCIMKKTFAIILALAAAGQLASCTKDEGDSRSLIQGDWTLVRTTYTETTNGVNEPDYESGFYRSTLHYVFGEKNQWTTFNYNDPAYSTLKGTYKLRGNELTITIPPTHSDGVDDIWDRTVDVLDETTLVLSYTDEYTGALDRQPHTRRITQTYKKGNDDVTNETVRMLEGSWKVVDGSVRVVYNGEVSTLPLLGEGEACLFGFDTKGMWTGVTGCAALASLWHGDISDGEITLTGFYTVEGNRLALDNMLSSYSGDHENPPCFTIEQLEENALQLGIDLDYITTGDTTRVTRITLKLKKDPGSKN